MTDALFHHKVETEKDVEPFQPDDDEFARQADPCPQIGGGSEGW